MKRLYTVRLTSDDWTSECEFHLTPAARDLLLEIAAAFNAKATYAVDVRVFVDPADSAAPQGDAVA